MSQRPILFCNKCKQLKPTNRESVGTGWIVCECDKPKAQIKTEDLRKPKENTPFVFNEKG